MDPKANLREQREVSHRIMQAVVRGDAPDAADAERLADLMLALDDWRLRGGFDPYLAR